MRLIAVRMWEKRPEREIHVRNLPCEEPETASRKQA
jgi:hypothetical protein